MIPMNAMLYDWLKEIHWPFLCFYYRHSDVRY